MFGSRKATKGQGLGLSGGNNIFRGGRGLDADNSVIDLLVTSRRRFNY